MGLIRRKLEDRLNELWYRREPPSPGWRALSFLYGKVSGRGQHSLDRRPVIPVIVVGNITVGGGGKTPVVAALAQVLSDDGLSPAIISRGYGGRSPGVPLRVEAGSDPGICGDEPVLLARQTGCAVWVCRRRSAALEAAMAAGADCVISDDGLQHHRLPRSFEICVIDEQRGFGNGYLLPAGPLREPVERLQRVDLVLRKQIGDQGLAVPLPGLAFALQPSQAYRLGGNEAAQLDRGTVYDAVCAIANPDSFFGLLEQLDCRFRRHPFPDHHAFGANDLAGLEGPMLVTEKDAVKLARLDGLPETLVLPVRARLPQEATLAVIDHVREFSPS